MRIEQPKTKVPKTCWPEDRPTGAARSRWDDGGGCLRFTEGAGAGLLATVLATAGREDRSSAGTFALRWCSVCRRFLGVKLWPRTDRSVVHTHGLCLECFKQLMGDEIEVPSCSEPSRSRVGDEALL
jgi:hypothetical protein